MSDTSEGPGWWIASDGRWYPPEFHPAPVAPPAGITDMAYGAQAGPYGAQTGAHGTAPLDSLSGWAPAAAPPMVTGAVDGYLGGPGGSRLPVAPTSSGRFDRGLKLVGIGFTMARDEPGLMAVPVVAFVAQLAVIGVGALILVPGIRSASSADGGTVHLSATQWLVVVAAGVAVTFISVVSHATIIARVMARFHGQSVTNAQAARAALTKSPLLLVWAFINYVVISVLRSIGNRGVLGLLVGWLLRAGWMMACLSSPVGPGSTWGSDGSSVWIGSGSFDG